MTTLRAITDAELAAAEIDATAPKPRDPKHYINRELSQLAFQYRVLAQAKDPQTPLLERLRFLCISCTNLDEFFEIRVAALRQQVHFATTATGTIIGPDGMSPSETLARVREGTEALVAEQYAFWNQVLRPELRRNGISLLTRDEWNPKQKQWLHEYFQSEIMPVLSPLGLDPAHPFPRILNKSLNVVVELKGKDAFGREANMAVVRAPRSLPRIIRLPAELDGDASSQEFVFLSAILHEFVGDLFPGMQVKGSYQFRVTRNSELIVEEEEVENLAHALKDELEDRGFARAVRIEVAETCPAPVLKHLIANFELTEQDVYRCNGPVNLNRVIAVYDMVDRPDLKFAPFQPRIQSQLANQSIFDALKKGDALLHHPFDSFTSVLDLLRQAASDPAVLAIKQTLYRTGKDSPVVASLIDAARAGKDVTVVVELRARFDEEANIQLANRLQEAGVQVVYGVVGYKTHAKMCLVVRREKTGELKRYVHLATGNYHFGTAKVYTDIGLLTSNPEIGEDIHRCFQQLSGLGPVIQMKRILHSPFTLHRGLLAKIEREIAHAKAGKPARIAAKINHLAEPAVIEMLYEASRAGVKVDLVVRGTCALRPGIPGVSDHITVRSVVGRFLEHSRVYYFENAGQREIWCSSADWLERNLLRRIEICFPILDRKLAERVYEEEIENYLADNVQAWKLESDGTYVRVTPGDATPHSAQQALLAKLTG